MIGLRHLEQAAVFDGIARTRFTPEYLASAGSADWTYLRAAIEHTRAGYGPDQFDALFQTGAQMTYDQAVEHTLRILDEVIVATGNSRTP